MESLNVPQTIRCRATMQEITETECNWIEHGHTEKELLEWGRQMIQEKTLPYMGDWEINDEMLDDMNIPMKRIAN